MTTTYAYDSLSRLTDTTVNSNGAGSATGSPKVMDYHSDYIWNDAVSATGTGATGIYLLDSVADSQTRNSGDTLWTNCAYRAYDGQGFANGPSSGLTLGEVTFSDINLVDGTSGNGFACSNNLRTTYAYDASGNLLATSDPDANAGVTSHQGCTPSASVATSGSAAPYTTCTAYDANYGALPVQTSNALNQTTQSGQALSAAGGWENWPTSSTDANGQMTSYSYDVLGRRTAETLPGETTSPTLSWTYTNWCQPTGAQAPCLEVDQTQRLDSGHTVTQRAFFDGLGREVETRTPAPGGQDVVVYHQYDAMGRDIKDSVPYYVAAYTGAPGSAAFAVADTGQPGTTTTFNNSLERDVIVTDALSHPTENVAGIECGGYSDSACYVTTTTTDAAGHRSLAIKDALGRLTYSETDTGTTPATYSAYQVTKQTYDLNGALTQVTRPDGKTITYTVDPAGRVTALSDPDRGSETYSYDHNGNLTESVDARGASGTVYAAYDGLDRPLWRNTNSSPSGAYVTYGYDSSADGSDGVGRLTSETFSNANVGGALSGSYATTYDARGQVSASDETLGAVGVCPTGWSCADIGAPAQVGTQAALGSGAGGGAWQISGGGADIWGTSDQFHFVSQPQSGDGSLSAQVVTQQATDPWAKTGVMLRASTDPGAAFYAVELTGGNGLSVEYRASQGGSAAIQVEVGGVHAPQYVQVTRTGTTLSAATSSDGVTWAPVANSSVTISALSGSVLAGVAVTAHNTGTLSAARVEHVVTSSGGGMTQPSSATTATTSASYNDAGELTSQTYPDGDLLSTSYDAASGWATGESVKLNGSQTTTPLLTNESYSGAAGALGLLTSASLGAFTGGSGAFAASYDTLGRLTSAQYSYTPTGGSATTLYQAQPTYDALSNVIESVTTLPQGTDTQVFCYDDLSRLTWAGSSGTPACSGAPTPGDTGSLAGSGASYDASYTYDALDRLTSGPLGSYGYGDASHTDAATAVGTTWSASYDAAGNMTCRAASSGQTCAGSSPNGAQLGYNNEGQLATWHSSGFEQSASYLYDGAGNRVEQQQSCLGCVGQPATTSYIGSLEEVTTSGGLTPTTTTTAYYGGLAESVNGTLSYLLSDGLGSISAAVSTAGSVSATQLYAPYGGVRYQSGTLPTSKGFTGQRADTATSGLDYYGARYYDPVVGQFTSADAALAGGLNRFAYVAGNPETLTDPSGHYRVRPTGGGAPTHQRDTGGGSHAGGGNGSGGSGNSGGGGNSSGWSVVGSIAWQALDATTGIPSMISDVQTLASGNASLTQKLLAGGDLAFNLFMDATMVIGVGEGLRAAYVGARLAADVAEHVAADAAEHAAEDTLEHAAEDTLEHAGEDAAGEAGGAAASGGCAGGLSFAAATLVATPSGERSIASLRVGQQVEAYDPTTGKQTPQTIVRVFLNHDRDRLDVTLAYQTPATAAASRVAARSAGRVARAGQGYLAATTTSTATATKTATTHDEVIHTTANHPWLSADHGWLVAGQLRVGEPVRLLDGATATVVALRSVPGVGPMWDLSLDATHTFAVGDVQAVVHNCDDPVGQVTFGETELSQQVKGARIDLNETGHNFAAARMDDGEIVVTHSNAGAHAEESLVDYAEENGKTIEALYSERQPCAANCADMLMEHNPGMRISWTWPWEGENTALSNEIQQFMRGVIRGK